MICPRELMRLRITGGPLTNLRLTLHGRTVTRKRTPERITVRAPKPGRYRLRATATAPDGKRLVATRRIRVRR